MNNTPPTTFLNSVKAVNDYRLLSIPLLPLTPRHFFRCRLCMNSASSVNWGTPSSNREAIPDLMSYATVIKSLLKVPAHASKKLLAAFSTAFKSVTPREKRSPKASWVSKVDVTVARHAVVIPAPARVTPAFCTVSKTSFNFLWYPYLGSYTKKRGSQVILHPHDYRKLENRLHTHMRSS